MLVELNEVARGEETHAPEHQTKSPLQASLDDARKVAQRLATERLEDQHQVDTYFHSYGPGT